MLDVGRKTRTIPPAIRRALTARDTQCQFPGCSARRCDAHHVVHWADGGVTALDNLVLLCRRHHRLLHEGGYTVRRDVEGTLRFVRPNGHPLAFVPEPPRWTASAAPLGPTVDRLAAAGLKVGPHTAPLWDGTPFNVGVVIDALRGNEPLDRPGPVLTIVCGLQGRARGRRPRRRPRRRAGLGSVRVDRDRAGRCPPANHRARGLSSNRPSRIWSYLHAHFFTLLIDSH